MIQPPSPLSGLWDYVRQNAKIQARFSTRTFRGRRVVPNRCRREKASFDLASSLYCRFAAGVLLDPADRPFSPWGVLRLANVQTPVARLNGNGRLRGRVRL
jgi:hypothetical protein